MDLKRVKKEATELLEDKDDCGVSAAVVGDNMSHWKVGFQS
jgi:ubiquitin-protein ligase